MAALIIILTTLLLALIPACCYLLKLVALQFGGKKLPPGSFGFPLVGESISFVRARTQDKTEKWLQERIDKFGPVFRTSLFGSNVVVLTSQAGNRLAFSGGDNGISYQQPNSVSRIIGKNNLFEISGSRHKLIRGAIVGFLKPESIQKFVGVMDSVVQEQLRKELHGKDSLQIVKLMKKISFNVTCSIFFGLPDGKEKDALLEDFSLTLKGSWALPLNFPGTVYHRALKARARLCERLSKLIDAKRIQLKEGTVDTNENIISSLLNLRDENDDPLQEEVILDIFLSLIMASHDTTTILMTFLMRYLSRDAELFDKVLQEQMEVVRAKKGSNGFGGLTWSEMQMMKYTWRVAQEVMRFYPPIFGNFRLATRDISFDGFYIPKGWQLLWVASGTHMENNIFEDPYKFNPSRFDASSKTIPRFSYIPFGAGPRICPGAEFARIESLLVIHHLITKYKWTEMIPDEPITRQPLPYPAMGLPVRLEPRNVKLER